ncbi:MAG: alpha/beta fold hydrolase [Alphaproteobacteria bacterium]|nr:alpha/beta fold hydrolase [Alphaproteobacteria bacterium]
MKFLRWLWRGLALVVAAAAIAYPAFDWLRVPLDDAARNALLASGQAQRFVTLPAGVTQVRVDGPAGGPVVVLIHGFSAAGFVFDDWIAPLSAAGYRVIVPDLYGHGYSERLAGPYTKEIYVEQIASLLDALQASGPVHVVGSSMGGSVTASFAARYPGRVKSVTLIAPAGLQEAKSEGRWASAPVIGDWMARVLGPSVLEYGFAQVASRTKDPFVTMEKFRECSRFRGHAEGVLDVVRHYDFLSQTADFDALGRSGLPVLAVWGTADQVIPFAQSAALKRRVPQALVVALKGLPHGTPIFAPDATMAPILPFLAKAEGR